MEDEQPNEITRIFREWRLKAGRSQEDAAVLFQVEQSTVSKWEAGSLRMTSILHLARLENLVGKQEKGERLARERKR